MHGDPINATDPWGTTCTITAIWKQFPNKQEIVDGVPVVYVRPDKIVGYRTTGCGPGMSGPSAGSGSGGDLGTVVVVHGVRRPMVARGHICTPSSFWGKVKNVPNTAIGLVWAGFNVFAADMNNRPVSMQFGHNSLEILNAPFEAEGRAVTLGNVTIYPRGISPNTKVGPYSGAGSLANIGDHEEGHTIQSEQMGVLYIPFEILGATSSGDKNPMETGADDYARNQSCNAF